MALSAEDCSPAVDTAADRAERMRVRARELHTRAAALARRAERARADAVRERLGAESWRRGLEADERERRRAVGRWMDMIASDSPAGLATARRGLAFFDADFCLTNDRPAMVAALLAAALRFSRAQMGNVQLVDAEAGGLRIAAQHGFEPSFLRYFDVVDDDRSACGVALAQARTVHVHDVSRSPVFDQGPARGVLLDAGVRAVRSLPLIGPAREPLGVLSVHYARPHDPTDAERKLLTTLADAAVRRLLRPPSPDW